MQVSLIALFHLFGCKYAKKSPIKERNGLNVSFIGETFLAFLSFIGENKTFPFIMIYTSPLLPWAVC